jgi:phenylacetate-coenzyme A ligase PaaK-like adenylate-forming protein
MQETISAQHCHYDFYRGLMRLSGFELASLSSFDAIADIPYITSGVLKNYHFTSSAKHQPALTVSSSGTTGQKAQISIDEVSLMRIVAGILKVYGEFGLASEQAANYLFAGYSPSAANGAGTAGTDMVVSLLTPQLGSFYVLDLNADGSTVFLKDQAVQQLRQFVQQGAPVRMLGFLHYVCEIVKAYHQQYGMLNLPPDSYILSGGGWKEFARHYGEDFNLYAYLAQFSNIQASSIRDSYSLVEHPVLYVACEKNHLHVSALAHVLIRDVKTMAVLPHGQTGLVQLFTPILQSYPSASLLTTDLASLEQHCECGRVGDYLKIEGRGGSKKPMTCALNAEQYMAGASHA